MSNWLLWSEEILSDSELVYEDMVEMLVYLYMSVVQMRGSHLRLYTKI